MNITRNACQLPVEAKEFFLCACSCPDMQFLELARVVTGKGAKIQSRLNPMSVSNGDPVLFERGTGKDLQVLGAYLPLHLNAIKDM